MSTIFSNFFKFLFMCDRRAHEVLWTSALRRPEWNVDSNLRGYGLTPQKKKAPCFCMVLFLFQSDRRGSNPRSRPWQGRALPTTPLSRLFLSLYLSDLFNIPYLKTNVNYFSNFFKFLFMCDRRAHEVQWTSALRRPERSEDSNFRVLDALLKTKKDEPFGSSSSFLRAIDGARTRGLDLGKVARYQLRHYRIYEVFKSSRFQER